MRRFECALLLLFALAAVAQNVPVPYISQPLSPTTVAPGSKGFTLTPLRPVSPKSSSHRGTQHPLRRNDPSFREWVSVIQVYLLEDSHETN
jgi:hypothetical protein